MKRERLNLELDIETMKALRRVQVRMRAASLTETIRRSVEIVDLKLENEGKLANHNFLKAIFK